MLAIYEVNIQLYIKVLEQEYNIERAYLSKAIQKTKTQMRKGGTEIESVNEKIIYKEIFFLFSHISNSPIDFLLKS